MNIDPEELRAATRQAWRNICELRIFPEKKESGETPDPSLVFLLMPLGGWGFGVLLFLAVTILRFTFNPAAGLLLFLLISWIFLSWKDSGRSDRILMHEILLIFRRGEEDCDHPLLLIIPPLMLRFLMLFLLGNFNGAGYLPVFLLFAAGNKALLMMKKEKRINREERRHFFMLAGLLLLASLFFTRLETVLALTVWLCTELWHLHRNGRTLSERESLLFCGITEWLLLLAGILSL